jgi:hypothetical protein
MNTEREGELAEVAKLRRARAVESAVLSLYLSVPLDPAQLRSLPVRASELMAAAAGGPAAGGRGRLADADRDAVREMVRVHGRDWLGRTMAVFACADMGLLEVLRLRCEVPERAVLAARPLIWPLLASLQWRPDYRVVVVDSARVWVFSISGDEIETIVIPSTGGVDTYRAWERVRDLAASAITTWADQKARRLAAEILRTPPGGPAAVGLPVCLASVNARSVAHLVIPGGGLVPGYACGRCGLLGIAGECPDCGIAAQPVPDLLDEMVHRTIDDDGKVSVIRGEAFQVAAWLRFPARRQ